MAVARSTAALVAGALVAWIVLVDRMRGMEAGPGTDLGALGWYLGVWVTMTAAMMLPSAAPMTRAFASVGRSPAGTPVFLAGYLLVWTGYGLVAYAAYRGLRASTGGFEWNSGGRYAGGVTLAAAGIYELTPLKSACLRHCRTPFTFVLGRWRPGWRGALRMGIEHGAYCVGCCFGLMLVLFVLGVMSIVWMVVVAALVFGEKVLPAGDRLPLVVSIALLLAALWLVT